VTAGRQLSRSLAKYSPEVRAIARGALARMRKRLPGAVELVYDNFNALVVGFGPTERASDAVFSIALYPRWVNLYFLDGALLDDPLGLLKGAGSRVRRVVVTHSGVLDEPGVRALMAQAIANSDVPFNRSARRRVILKAVSARQRPRRPRASPPAAPR
jgi:hypothetical protein